ACMRSGSCAASPPAGAPRARGMVPTSGATGWRVTGSARRTSRLATWKPPAPPSCAGGSHICPSARCCARCTTWIRAFGRCCGCLVDPPGAYHYVDPRLTARLIGVGKGRLEELAPCSPADLLLVDTALLAYFNAWRVQGWIGDTALLVEHEFFSDSSPTAKWK